MPREAIVEFTDFARHYSFRLCQNVRRKEGGGWRADWKPLTGISEQVLLNKFLETYDGLHGHPTNS
jgi:hypothetical protein